MILKEFPLSWRLPRPGSFDFIEVDPGEGLAKDSAFHQAGEFEPWGSLAAKRPTRLACLTDRLHRTAPAYYCKQPPERGKRMTWSVFLKAHWKGLGRGRLLHRGGTSPGSPSDPMANHERSPHVRAISPYVLVAGHAAQCPSQRRCIEDVPIHSCLLPLVGHPAG